MIASTCRVATSTFDTDGTAPSSSFIDGGVYAWDGTILELVVVRVDTYGVVLLTGEDVVFALVIDPGDIIWVGRVQVVARVRAGRCSGCGGVDKSEGSDGDLHVCVFEC